MVGEGGAGSVPDSSQKQTPSLPSLSELPLGKNRILSLRIEGEVGESNTWRGLGSGLGGGTSLGMAGCPIVVLAGFWVVTQYRRHPNTLPWRLPLTIGREPPGTPSIVICIDLSARKEVTILILVSDAPKDFNWRRRWAWSMR